MYYIYIIRCQDESLYTGLTTDLKRRFQEHLSGSQKAAKYTRTHPVKHLEACWLCENRKQASQLEYWLKRLTKKQKELIIQDNNYFYQYLNQHLCVDVYCRETNITIEKKEMEKDDNKRSQ